VYAALNSFGDAVSPGRTTPTARYAGQPMSPPNRAFEFQTAVPCRAGERYAKRCIEHAPYPMRTDSVLVFVIVRCAVRVSAFAPVTVICDQFCSAAAQTETRIINTDGHLQIVQTERSVRRPSRSSGNTESAETTRFGHSRPLTPCAKSVLVGGIESRMSQPVPLLADIQLNRLLRPD